MRILIVSHAADRTGAPISALQMAAALQTQGHDIRFILRRGGELAKSYSQLADTFIWREDSEYGLLDAADTALRYDPLMALKCLRNPDRPYCLSRQDRQRTEIFSDSARDWAPDVVYANTTHCGDVLDSLECQAPVITHVREMTPTIRALDRRRLASTLRQTNLFLCASTSVRNDLARDFAIADARMRVEPPAVELNPAQATEADARRRDVEQHLGLAPQDRLVLGAGSLIARKGPDLFVEAAIAASQKYRGEGRLVFAWLGEGKMLAQLKERVIAADLADSILLPGLMSDPFPYFRRASVLLVTSREDPYPRVAIEAAALGIPVAAYAEGGGAADLVRDYEAGVLVEDFSHTGMAEAALALASRDAGPDDALAARVAAGHAPSASAARVVTYAEGLIEAAAMTEKR